MLTINRCKKPRKGEQNTRKMAARTSSQETNEEKVVKVLIKIFLPTNHF